METNYLSLFGGRYGMGYSYRSGSLWSGLVGDNKYTFSEIVSILIGMLTFALSVSSSESLCWRVFWKSATRASLDCSCLFRFSMSLQLDCSCTQ